MGQYKYEVSHYSSAALIFENTTRLVFNFLTGVMTLRSASPSNSNRSLVCIAVGTRRGGYLTGFVASSVLRLTGPFRQPRVNDFRWFLYSTRTADDESLLSKAGSLIMYIQRADYVAMLWRKAGESHPHLPSPVDWGWEFDTTRHHYAHDVCIVQPLQL